MLVSRFLLSERKMKDGRAGSWRISRALVEDNRDVMKDKGNSGREMKRDIFGILWVNLSVGAQGSLGGQSGDLLRKVDWDQHTGFEFELRQWGAPRAEDDKHSEKPGGPLDEGRGRTQVGKAAEGIAASSPGGGQLSPEPEQ